ncbi:MAG: UDP binding domain-containing protein, partial [Candidatus Micrarchaeota archaeon]
KNGYEPRILNATVAVNEEQPHKLAKLARESVGSLKGKRVALLGLAFKEETDDMRDAPSIKVVDDLIKEGASVVAYDPAAMENSKKIFGKKIEFAKSAQEALASADCCIVVTEWKEFGKLSANDFKKMKSAVVIEGRKILDAKALIKGGVKYVGIGRKLQ